MRLVSQYRNFEGQTLRDYKEMVLQTGDRQVLQTRHFAGPFIHGALTDHEFDEALKAWPKLRGLSDGEEIRWRFSSADTNEWAREQEWSAKEKEAYEARLRNEAGEHYIVVDQVKLPAPWPAYDKLVVHGQRKVEHVVEKIVGKIKEDEYEVDQVIAYERQNLNRDAVISALEALKEPEPEEPLIAA